MKYTIGNPIGDPGGFGKVCICTSEIGDNYAIKILNEMDNEMTERFIKEIRLTKRLSHPNIVKIIAHSVESNANDPRKYYIMPHYKCSLAHIIPDLHNKFDRQYKVLTEILNGIIYLHSEGVIHRDLKPQNILYNSDSDIVITDFGFGRQFNSDSERLTQVGAAFGTAKYMAPEQFADASRVDERSDIFSFGMIFDDIVTNMMKHTLTENQDIEYIIDKCTRNKPSERFSTIIDVKTAIDSVYQQLLGLVENNSIEPLLSKLRLGKATIEDSMEAALKLLQYKDNDFVEDYFKAISNDHYMHLEKNHAKIAENLIKRLQEHYTGQSWGFNYTDSICINCENLYNTSRNPVIRANMLYAIIEVGITHNRFYVMGRAGALLTSGNISIPESLELSSFLSKTRIKLDRFNIDKNELPNNLQQFYEE